MKNKLDTSWFKLKNYEELKTLDLYGWERQISKRQNIKKLFSFSTRLAAILFEDIKVSPIVKENEDRERWRKWRKSDANHPYNTNSVFNIPAESLKSFSDSLRLRSPNDELRNSLSNYYSCREKAELSETQPDSSSQNIDRANFQWPINPAPLKRAESPELPNDTPTIGGDRGSFLKTTAVMIDLSASDKQIKEDFDHWLSEYRKAMECTAGEFTTEIHWKGWVRKGLLPYIDLMLAAEFDGLKLDHVDAAKLIFPGFSGNPDNKIRRTTKPQAVWLMEEETLFAIQAQLRSMPSE